MSDNILKKEFNKRDVTRLRNIITKKHGDKTITQSGYEKSTNTHKEGDVWEENGKTWTITRGIKQNITKLDDFKKEALMPILCPGCNKPMNHRLDSKYYKIHKKCFDCVIDYETKLKLNGEYEEYEKKMMKGNVESHINDIEQLFEEWILSKDEIMTEQGDIENWEGSKNVEELRKQFNEYINGLKSFIKS